MKKSVKIPELSVKPARNTSHVPRLVKAAEQATRQAAVLAAPAVKREARPVVVRTPRGATEARTIFQSLFRDPAKA